MTKVQHTSAKLMQPTVTPLLDGTFDVNYIQTQGTNGKILSKNFTNKADAELFAENQYVVLHYRKIDSFLSSLAYLQACYKDTYRKMLPFIGNVRLALNLVTPQTTRQEFADLLANGLMANIIQLKGKQGTNTHSTCTRLLTMLDAFVKAYHVANNEVLDFEIPHQFNTHLDIKNNLQVLR